MEQYTVCEIEGTTVLTTKVEVLQLGRLQRIFDLIEAVNPRAMQIASMYLVTVTTCGAVLFA
jgi:hypothetical protein